MDDLIENFITNRGNQELPYLDSKRGQTGAKKEYSEDSFMRTGAPDRKGSIFNGWGDGPTD